MSASTPTPFVPKQPSGAPKRNSPKRLLATGGASSVCVGCAPLRSSTGGGRPYNRSGTAAALRSSFCNELVDAENVAAAGSLFRSDPVMENRLKPRHAVSFSSELNADVGTNPVD